LTLALRHMGSPAGMFWTGNGNACTLRRMFRGIWREKGSLRIMGVRDLLAVKAGEVGEEVLMVLGHPRTQISLWTKREVKG
jgi:hypothetical protein